MTMSNDTFNITDICGKVVLWANNEGWGDIASIGLAVTLAAKYKPDIQQLAIASIIKKTTKINKRRVVTPTADLKLMVITRMQASS